MIIAYSQSQVDRALRFLAQSEDAEPVSGGGYTCDLYELDPPVALELYPSKGGLDITAAFVLNYDEKLDGYYLGEKLETVEAVRQAISAWPPLAED